MGDLEFTCRVVGIVVGAGLLWLGCGALAAQICEAARIPEPPIEPRVVLFACGPLALLFEILCHVRLQLKP